MTRVDGNGTIPSADRMRLRKNRDRTDALLQGMKQGLALLSILLLAPLAGIGRFSDPKVGEWTREFLARRASDQIPIFETMNRPFVFLPLSPAPRSVESLTPSTQHRTLTCLQHI